MARHDGQRLLVFGGIPGERVGAELVRRGRHYLSARVVEVLEPSAPPDEPPLSLLLALYGLPVAAHLL